MTLATWVTVLRILMLGPFVLCMFKGWHIASALVIIVAGLSDFLDGYLARSRNEVSALGAALDPIADKILIGGALFVLGGTDLITNADRIAILLIIAREFLVSGFREAAAGTIDLPVTYIAKLKTTAQFVAVVALILAPTGLASLILWTAAGLTIWTGAQYVRAWIMATLK